MSRDQLSSSFEGEIQRPDMLGMKADEIEATRLAEALAALDHGEAPDIDPIEDPALASLTTTAQDLRLSLEAASAEASFDTFRARSRRRVVAATPQTSRDLVVSESRGSLLQRWNGLFTSVASAASAAVATLVVTLLAIGGGASTDPLATVQVVDGGAASVAPAAAEQSNTPDTPVNQVNLTALSVDEQIAEYQILVARLSALTNEGEPADAELLRSIADTSATVARTIEEQPAAVSGKTAWDAYHATYAGQQVLNEASVASDDDQVALDTAQVVAGGAFVTAARYLGNPQLAPTYQETVAAFDAPDPSESLGTEAAP